MSALTYPTTIPVLNGDENGLTAYLSQIRKFPMLSVEDEQKYAIAWRDEQDKQAAHRLVTSHLRLVAKIAMKYKGYGLPMSEVISEGNVGLMQAVKKFDPDRGFRLSTYAMWWIKASIQEYILHSWSLVKIGTTAAQKKLFFNLRKMKNSLANYDGETSQDLTNEQADYIAEKLSVTRSEVYDMNGRMGRGGDQSLNTTVHTGEESTGQWQDMLAEEGANQETITLERDEYNKRYSQLSDAMNSLNARERDIFTRRRMQDNPPTLEDLSGEYGVSRERIRQIEMGAFDKVQRIIIGS